MDFISQELKHHKEKMAQQFKMNKPLVMEGARFLFSFYFDEEVGQNNHTKYFFRGLARPKKWLEFVLEMGNYYDMQKKPRWTTKVP